MSGRDISEELIFLPLGGTGEIGMNLNLYGFGGRWLMVDLGVSFSDDVATGIDVIMADPAFIEERRHALDGLVITHAHEDHIGAVAYLWNRLRCPIWASPFAASLLRAKLSEAGISDEVSLTVVKPGEPFTVGPFALEYVAMTHSIPEANSLVIRTPLGTVFHTGDWKFDPTPLINAPVDMERLERIGDGGVLAVVGDSTNVLSKRETRSEADVRSNLRDLIGIYDAKIAVACFATNIARVESIALAAQGHGRHTILVGRSLWRLEKAARENGYLVDLPPFLTEHDAATLKPEKSLYICTGSQGEANAALSRIASGGHPRISLGKGDVAIFSSRIIPGNEKAIGKVHNQLIERGVEIVTENDRFIHVSGHPGRPELKKLYGLLRPRYAVPVHGEARHLMAHADLAESSGVSKAFQIRNGMMLRLAPGEPEVVAEVAVGCLALDGSALVRMDSATLRDRRKMFYGGTVVVTVVVNSDGRLLCPPQVSAPGLLNSEEEETEHQILVDAVGDAFERLSATQRRNDDSVREAVRFACRRTVKIQRGKKPLTEVHLVRV